MIAGGVIGESTSTAAPAATASASPAAAGATPGTPAFDAVLLLQGLAATPEGLEGGDEAELLGLEDGEDDDDPSDELEASLAFLSQLLTATASASRGSHDFQQGGGGDGRQDGPPAPALGGAIDGAALAAANDVMADDEVDAMLTASRPEPLDARAAGDASQNLARAAEILAAGARPGADVEKSTLTTPARDPRWANELGTRVSLMVRQGESTASLQLTPVDLGPVEVNVTVKDSQASVHFGASQAETRALLEASLPKLREMLAAQGYQLADSSVSSGFARARQEHASPSRGAAAEAETATTESRAVRLMGLLDLYA